MFYYKAKNDAINRLKKLEEDFNKNIQKANNISIKLYKDRKDASAAIKCVEDYINNLANSPKEFKRDIAEVVCEISEFNEAVKIEEENFSDNIKGASIAVVGGAAGGAVAFLGPTAAMAIATTFGTASTGTAIASLSGAAATNAALAWLGGGALAAGGGGMAAGNALLALAGPIGWTIAGTLAVAGGAFAFLKNKAAAKEANRKAEELIIKKNNLLSSIQDLEHLVKVTVELTKSISIAQFNLAPKDYTLFTEEQKQALLSVNNFVKTLGKCINERIKF